MSRREAIAVAAKGLAGATLAVQALKFLGDGIPEASGPVFENLKHLLRGANPELFAQVANRAKHPIINILCIDKLSNALVFPVSGTLGTGDLIGLDGAGQMFDGASIAGLALPENTATWRGLQLKALFANQLSSMNANYNLAFFPQFSSNSGGHSLQNANLGMDKGGINFAAEISQKASGLLGPVGFGMRGDANDSRDAFVKPGRISMPTFANVGQLLQTVKNSAKAIASKGSDQYDLRRKLDGLALKNNESVAQLVKIRDMVDPALEPLQAALSETNVVRQQLAAIIALAKAGLAANFMLVIPWDDTNGGGDLRTQGGAANINPYVGHRLLGEVYARLATELPNAITVLSSDGGRSRNNGDSAAGFSIVSGPSTVVKNGIYGSAPAIDALGSNNAVAQSGTDIRLSNGTVTRVLEHKHLMSLALHAIGYESGIPYPIDPLV